MTTTITPVPSSSRSISAVPTRGPTRNHQDLQPRSPSVSQAGAVDVCLLGVNVVLGGQFSNWSKTLAAGLVPAVAAFIAIGSAYIVQVSSLAEVASVFPFGGGVCAVTRKSLGFYGGFMVGAIDAIVYILIVAAYVLALTDNIITSVPHLRGLEPIMWILFFLSATLLQTRSHVLFWRVSALLSVISLMILLIFYFGSWSTCDISKYSVKLMDVNTRTPRESLSFTDMLRVLPFCAWLHVGIDATVVASDTVRHPQEVIPSAMRSCMAIVVVTAGFTAFVTASLPAGTSVLADAASPLSYGFTDFLGLSVPDAGWLSIPATYASAFGFLWVVSRLLTSLASSKLLPSPLSARLCTQVQNSSSVSSRAEVRTASCLCFIVCLLVQYCFHHHRQIARNVSIGLAFLSNSIQTLGFIALRNGNGDALSGSAYRSPFGVAGAVFALIIWGLAFVSIVCFQDNHYGELIVIAVMLAVLSVYYHAYAQHNQVISTNERSILSVVTPPGRHIHAVPLETAATLKHTKNYPLDGSFLPQTPHASITEADSSFSSNGSGPVILFGSGSMRQSAPELVEASHRLANLLKEYPELADSRETIHRPTSPPRERGEEEDESRPAATPQPDKSLEPRTATSGIPGQQQQQPHGDLGPHSLVLGGGWKISLLPRNGPLAKLREETERDLKSGIWTSEKSIRESRGRGKS